MSKRLQVLLTESEFDRFRGVAKSERMSLGEWVRNKLREACEAKSSKSPEEIMLAVERASKFSFPSGDIEQINAEIEKGYLSGLS